MSRSSGSAIKGGGRAAMSDMAEDAVVSLLLSLRSDDNNNNNADTTALSDHDRKREHKRFLKRLVEQYERRMLQEQFNQGRARATITTATTAATTIKDNPTSKTTTVSPLPATAAASSAEDETANGNGKVRIELCEAIFSTTSDCKPKKDNNKSLSSSSSSSSSKTTKSNSSKDNKKSSVFKVGTKKMMVVSRSMSIGDLLKQAKNKLRLKQAPLRCFVVSENTKTQVDLVGDLRGVQDGTSLYVTTATATTTTPGSQSSSSSPKDANDNGNDITPVNDEVMESLSVVVDPLEAVKLAYAQKARQQATRQNKKNFRRQTLLPPRPHPCFSEHFDQLPPLSSHRATLPAASCREKILSAVDTSRVVIICGTTGCGKSSQVPQYLLEGMIAASQVDDAYILVTQPRRVAATSLAQRVAWERNSPPPGRPGSVVGYNVRLDRAIADETAQIVYCTVGILLRMLTSPLPLMAQPSDTNDETVDSVTSTTSGPHRHVPLSHISHIVIDEVHERDLNTDFALTLMKHVLRLNPTIRLILMSATASADLFVRYFETQGGTEPPPHVLVIPGRSFPVEIKWLGDCQRSTSRQVQGWTDTVVDDTRTSAIRGQSNTKTNVVTTAPLSHRATAKIDNWFLKSLIQSILRQQQQEEPEPPIILEEDGRRIRTNGAILVFLPGKAEIESLAHVLRNENGADDDDDDDGGSLGNRSVRILKLHSTIPRQEQQAVFQPALEGTTKIVLATNIAETSITISDVSHVIDTGRVKESRFNASSRIKELVTVWTSQASAKQRAGRAGRTSAGVCWRLYSKAFHQDWMPLQTPPEILRTPLDELVLQVCLLYEQRRDEAKQHASQQQQQQQRPNQLVGVSPIRFLSQTPEPPPDKSLLEACNHLLEVGAVHAIGINTVDEDDAGRMYRLTPLGYHLSRLPMDAKVGKVLIEGCILECLEGALTVAATLSHAQSCFPSQRWSSCTVAEWKQALEARNRLVESGFGGRDWKGGTVKGDLIACIAAYNEWSLKKGYKERIAFCKAHALDNAALSDISALRDQFKDCLVDAGFLQGKDVNDSFCNMSKDDALLTSCCLVAGLYPNVCTLMRPRKVKGGFGAGRLLTKDGDSCMPSSSSFQKDRVKNAAESGKDAYAVYHAKHRTLGTTTTSNNPEHQPGQVHLSQVNFVSRYALLLFGGELEIRGNAIIVDGWLKFKVGKNGTATAILLLELRSELDQVLLRRITSSLEGEDDTTLQSKCQKILEVVRTLLEEES